MLKHWGSAKICWQLMSTVQTPDSNYPHLIRMCYFSVQILDRLCCTGLRVLLTNQTPPRGSVHSDANNPEHVVLTANNHAHTLTRGALSCAVIHPLLGQTDGEMMNMLPLICSPSLQPPGNKCAAFFNKDVNDPHEAWIPIGERDREREK